MSVSQYNPADPTQASFLSALALTETGSNPNAYSEGFGGGLLAGLPTDATGFPIWGGSSTAAGPTHAAGAFQFQPGTWGPLAQAFGLNFGNPSDQNDAAWILAQQKYTAATGGDLETALASGQYSQVQGALAPTWQGVTGSISSGQGLAYDLAHGLGSPTVGGSSSASSSSASSSSSSAAGGGSAAGGTFLTAVESFFVRFGLLIAGAVIVVVALWQLLSDHSDLPSPAATAKAAGKGLAAAA